MHAGPMPLGFRGHCPDCGHDWYGKQWSVDCGLVNYPRIDFRLIWSLFQATQELPSESHPRGRARISVTALREFWRFCSDAFKAGSFFRHPKTFQSYFCSRCTVELRVPRRLNRRFWLDWVAENAVDITRSPLLLRSCETIARILAEARSRHVPVPIEIEEQVCPDCGDRMVIGNIHTSPLVCPRCKSRSARWVRGPWIILTDYGPPDKEAARRVIVHLC